MNVINATKAWRNTQQFLPGRLGWIASPFFLTRRALFRAINANAHLVTGRVIDIGCGSKPYISLFEKFYSEYIGVDIENEGHTHENEDIDVYYDGNHIPFDSNIFDTAVCFEVLEHVFNPRDFLKELNRVIRPGGILILTVPFVWDEHEQPNDYGRYSSFGLRHLLESSGFGNVKITKTGSDLTVLFQLVNAYFFKVFAIRRKEKRSNRDRFRSLFGLLLYTLVNAIALVFIPLFPANNDLFLDNVAIAKKLT
jgi:SAM-dependent methyltransferase